MDIYEVELSCRGRWEHQNARVVAARDADEAAYKETGEHLRREGERTKVRLRVRRLWGTEAQRPSCSTPPEALETNDPPVACGN
jgi:hypothetical protein